MRRAGRWVLGILVVLPLAFGALLLAFPEATAGSDGPADPILGIRRSALDGLRSLGLVAKPGFFFDDSWLPSATSWCVKNRREGLRWSREPVWRGLFWKVGERVSAFLVEDAATAPRGETLRLVALKRGRSRVVSEGRLRPHPLDPSLRLASVSGFVSSAAAGWRVEEVGDDGAVLSSRGVGGD